MYKYDVIMFMLTFCFIEWLTSDQSRGTSHPSITAFRKKPFRNLYLKYIFYINKEEKKFIWYSQLLYRTIWNFILNCASLSSTKQPNSRSNGVTLSIKLNLNYKGILYSKTKIINYELYIFSEIAAANCVKCLLKL